jgi:hypothetical protein
MCKDHCKFEHVAEAIFVLLTPLDAKAIEYIRVNGEKLKDVQPVELHPNDRIALGPGALFVFKNVEHEDKASLPDTAEDPISYDFADNELMEADEREDNHELAKEQEMLKKEAEAS